jgi:hypothetical protein
LADYLGNRQFYRSWGWWYILRPFIGAVAVLKLPEDLAFFYPGGGYVSS